MYRLFYDYHAIGDVLMIVFDNAKKATHSDIKDNVVVIYNGQTMIGINIMNISEIVRIKAKGMLLNPAPEFVEVINHILLNAGLEALPKQVSSGFVVGQILETISNEDEKSVVAKVDVGSRVVYVKASYPIIPSNALVVVALPATILHDGRTIEVEQSAGIFFEGYLCSKKDLNVAEGNPDDLYLLEEFMEIGQDFFAKE